MLPNEKLPKADMCGALQYHKQCNEYFPQEQIFVAFKVIMTLATNQRDLHFTLHFRWLTSLNGVPHPMVEVLKGIADSIIL